MAYDFSSLSAPDFEDLVRDLVGRELGFRFEGFSAGPDGGMDGRHATAKKTTILQAKHYIGSRFSALKSAMKRERASIDALKPDRYILATSRPLTPLNKQVLRETIGKALRHLGDIFGASELNGLLRKFPDIEKGHIKLWLSSVAVLERVIRSSAYSYTAASRAEIEAKVRVYAQNPSFKEARDRLENHRVLIISGPPGVGKTTLAEMLSYAYIGEEWEFHAIRSLDDGFEAIVDARKQIFFFDDFLGKVALDERALAQKDSDLARFMNRIRRSPNARFILTTRAYIFEQAKQISEQLADSRLNIAKYVLDVGVYTRRIKARILYNHLSVANISKDHVRSLVDANFLPRIIDHANYNPRIIEWMTDQIRISDMEAKDYGTSFLHALDNPSQIWDTAFRKHIPAKCQHLLFSLFFCSEYGAHIDDLRTAFNALHSSMCAKYGHTYGAKDFQEALKIIEGSFISIANGRISFVNPSVRDYLNEYLRDPDLLSDFASSALSAQWARALWEFFLELPDLTNQDKSHFARLFSNVLPRMLTAPVWKSGPSTSYARVQEIPNGDRIQLLLNWWEASRVSNYINTAIEIARNPQGGFSPWHDGETLIRLIIRSSSLVDLPKELPIQLERAVISLFDGWTPIDDLELIASAADEGKSLIAQSIVNAINSAIAREVDEADSNVSDIDSESTLNDHKKTLERLVRRIEIDTWKVTRAIEAIDARISQINERTIEAEKPSFSGSTQREEESFDNTAIANLFATLLS